MEKMGVGRKQIGRSERCRSSWELLSSQLTLLTTDLTVVPYFDHGESGAWHGTWSSGGTAAQKAEVPQK